jgi:HAD superfamily hydrolase (TIGR01549 family)
MKFKEVKRNVDGKGLVSWCDLVAKGPTEVILLYTTTRDYDFQGIHIPKGSTTKAHYWPNRNYIAWKMINPQGDLIGYLFHICEGIIIGEDHMIWNDLVVDLWVEPDRTHRILDEDELSDFLKRGLVSETQLQTIGKTRDYLVKNYREIIRDTFWGGLIRGVIFDMDGTITQDYIDWRRLRSEIGVAEGRTILEHIEGLTGEERRRATEILEGHEGEAALNSSLNDGVREVLSEVARMGIYTCLVTNNSRRSVDTVLSKHSLSFDLILTREDGQPKPSGDLLIKAREIIGLKSDEAIFVGDGRYDLLAGQSAGIRTIILLNDSIASYECDLAVESIKALPGLLK